MIVPPVADQGAVRSRLVAPAVASAGLNAGGVDDRGRAIVDARQQLVPMGVRRSAVTKSIAVHAID
jgi:hypothetical protein